MFNREKNIILDEFRDLLTLRNSRPYVFRTRLERLLIRASLLAKNCDREDILYICEQVKHKLKYVSDQSNQTSDGTLKSFVFLEDDIKSLYSNFYSMA